MSVVSSEPLPATMRALRLAGPKPVGERPLALVELPVPQPGPGEVLLRVRACGVCRTDLHIVEGELPPHRSPVVPGHQVVGEVVAFGAGAEGRAPGGEPGARPLDHGERVGVPWLHRTCGACRFCRAGRENLCEHALFTGWDVDGGFAEYMVAPADFVYRLPEGMDDLAAAPLLCAGIIGYRCLRLVGIVGDDAGLPGAAARRARPDGAGPPPRRPTCPVASACTASARRPTSAPRSPAGAAGRCTRSRAAPSIARWLSSWAPRGRVRRRRIPASSSTRPSSSLPPASSPSTPCARPTRAASSPSGGIYSTPIPPIEYPWIYDERVIRSVANSTRQDARELLRDAALVPVRSRVQEYDLEQANEALLDLKEDRVRGSAVLRIV